MPTIDIDSDAAHDAAQRELAKPIYPKPSLTELFLDWVEDLLSRLTSSGTNLPGEWLIPALLTALVIAAVLVAVHVARRTMRTDRGGGAGLFGEHELSAAEHRATAEEYAAQGNWSAAILHRLRAVARQLEETAVLEPIPGRTATELARDAGRVLPQLSGELIAATTAFNDVAYGDRPGTEAAYRLIVDLDDHLRHKTPAVTAGGTDDATADGWAGVQ